MAKGPLVARASTLAILTEALAKAASGRGSIALLRGEAGIGKSTVLAEAVATAEKQGFRIVAGRSWELGDAPPYFPVWPCLRSLAIEPPASGADPFRLWEEVLAALARIEEPVLWALEDLHAADLQTLDLLTFLVQPITTVRAIIVATTRAADLRITERASQRLVRIARGGHAIDLTALDEADVATVAGKIAGRVLAPFEVAQLFERTGGNPLFVVEYARTLTGAAPRALPPTVRLVVAERVELLPAETRTMIEAAAILGREASAATIARMLDTLPARVIDALLPAVDSGIMTELRPGTFAFTHIVVRDAIEDMIAPSRRSELHARAAAALEGDGVEALVERARHSLGTELATRATRALEELGAFDRALALHLRILEVQPYSRDQKLHVASIATAAGRFAIAKSICTEVIAQAAGDAELLARAALVLGAEIRPATVDPDLVRALREALVLLAEHPTVELVREALACRVLARLAAALQPADDPQIPIAMATGAIAKARALGDEAVLVEVLHVAVSVLLDYTSSDARIPLQRELLERALGAGDLAKAVRAQVLLAMSQAEQGDFSGCSASVDDALSLALRVGHPRHRWRSLLLDSMRALALGDAETSDRRVVEVKRLAALTDDPALMLSLNAHTFTAARLMHRDDELRVLVANIAPSLADVRHGAWIGAALRAGIGARLEDRALTLEALVITRQEPFGFAIDSLVASVAEAAAFVGDIDLCTRLLATFNQRIGEQIIGGMIPFTYEGPISRVVALLEAALGNRSDAEKKLQAALASAEASGHRAWCAQLHYDLGRLFGDLAHLRAAADLAEQIGMPGLIVRARQRLAPATARDPMPEANTSSEPRFLLAREGDSWRVEHAGRVMRVKDSRGVRMLARLVERPGEDVHVLVLASDEESASLHEDGIEALDDRARRQYKSRLDDLISELAGAEARADLGAVAKLRAERAALDGELRRAFGLGGKARTSSASEKARVNVQRRLKDAIARVGELDSVAGRFLEKAVSTGTYCRYFA